MNTIRPCRLLGLLLAVMLAGCGDKPATGTAPVPVPVPPPAAVAAPLPRPVEAARHFKVVHVFVALCDNRHQGIVPVPAFLGNGQEPKSNLYWGAQYGVKTFFNHSADWVALPLLAAPAGSPAILDRAVYKKRGAGEPVYVVAEAYNGADMRGALMDFFTAAAGKSAGAVDIQDGAQTRHVPLGGGADLVCFVGHNGLMDTRLTEIPVCDDPAKTRPRDAVVLACKSRERFAGLLEKARCRPVLTTAQYMAPEAYVLDTVLRGWAAGETPAQLRQRAGDAYAKHQKIKPAAAVRVFVAGE